MNELARHDSCAGETLYSNVEPCFLCSYVIRHHRLAAIVFDRAYGELGVPDRMANC